MCESDSVDVLAEYIYATQPIFSSSMLYTIANISHFAGFNAFRPAPPLIAFAMQI